MSQSESQDRQTMKGRSPARIGAKLERNLWAYACAAGVGMFAMTPSAEAKVVYTAANEQIPRLSAVPVDLNGDAKTMRSLHQRHGQHRANRPHVGHLPQSGGDGMFAPLR